MFWKYIFPQNPNIFNMLLMVFAFLLYFEGFQRFSLLKLGFHVHLSQYILYEIQIWKEELIFIQFDYMKECMSRDLDSHIQLYSC